MIDKLVKRDRSIDILKGFGIIFVVMGHASSPGKNFIYLFHMAIFFMASGYFYNTSKNTESIRSVFMFCKKKFVILWVPFFVWTTIFVVFNNLFIHLNIYTNNPQFIIDVPGKYTHLTYEISILDMAKDIINAALMRTGTQLSGTFWFLKTLLIVASMYCIIDFFFIKIFRKNILKVLVSQGITALILLFFGWKTGGSKLSVGIILSCYIIFYLGIVIRKVSMNRQVFFISWIISFLVLIILNLLGKIELSENYYCNPLFLIISSIAGWLFIKYLAEYVEKFSVGKVVEYIGQNSLSIMILHFACFKGINYFETIIFNKPVYYVAAFPTLYTSNGLWIIYVIAGILVPIVLVRGTKFVYKLLI